MQQLKRLVDPAVAVAAGLALLVSFPPYGLWWCAPIGVALLAVVTIGKRLRAGFGYGLLAGAVFFGPLLAWTNLHVGYTPWILLTLYQAVYFGLLGLALAATGPLLQKRPALTAPVVALLWVAQEAVRDRFPFGGFPWGRIAFSQGDSPALHFAAWGGAPLVTLVVALAGGLLVMWRLKWTIAAAVGLMALGLVVPVSTPDGPTAVVAVVQGNVPRLGLYFNEQRRQVLDYHVRATVELAERVKAGQVKQPDLVVWPENASDIDPLRDADAANAIDLAARTIKAPILVGGVLRGPGANESRNAGIVWLPESGAGEMYLKRHPVPFAEYLPMRPVVEPIAKMITNEAKLLQTDFVSGDVPGVLQLGPAKVGDVICFEVAYDDVVRDVVTHGAQLITVQTNNATFNEAEASQQLAMVRLRAVEHGRDSLMASTVGISAFVTADGTVHDATEFDTAAAIVRELHLGASTTLATRLGAWPEIALTVLAAGVLTMAVAQRVRRRRSGE